MTEWTAERMDATPEHVLREVVDIGLIIRTGDSGDTAWFGLETLEFYSSRFLAEMGPPKVVSVPIDALLSDEVIDATARAETAATWNRHTWDNYPDFAKDKARGLASFIIRAAIGHVTGEEI